MRCWTSFCISTNTLTNTQSSKWGSHMLSAAEGLDPLPLIANIASMRSVHIRWDVGAVEPQTFCFNAVTNEERKRPRGFEICSAICLGGSHLHTMQQHPWKHQVAFTGRWPKQHQPSKTCQKPTSAHAQMTDCFPYPSRLSANPPESNTRLVPSRLLLIHQDSGSKRWMPQWPLLHLDLPHLQDSGTL